MNMVTETQRQSVLYTILNMVGLGVSVLATIFIYPKNIKAYGIIQFLISTSYLLMPLLTLGIAATITKFFSQFKEKNRLPELLGFVIGIIFIASTVTFTIIALFKKSIYAFLQSINFDVVLLEKVDLYLAGIALCTAFSALLISYSAIFGKISVPSLINDLFVKLGVPLIVLLSVIITITDKGISVAYLIVCVIILLINVAYLAYLKKFDIKLPGKYTRSRFKEMSEYSAFTIFGGIGYLLIYRLDIFIITMLLDATQTGYYGILLFLAAIVEIPGKGLFKLLGPQISEAFSKNNLGKVEHLYIKASESLMLVAGALFVVILSGIKPFFMLIENGEFLLLSINIWILLVFAKWFDQVTGINSSIINYSDFYRYNIFFAFFQGVLNVVLNYYFITKYGLIGAAIATVIAVVSFNTLKTIFIYFSLKISPWSPMYLRILLFLVCFSLVAIYLPYTGYPILDFILRPFLLITLQVIAIYKFKLSEEINTYIKSILLKLNKLLV